jgi:cytochrome c-type biogenesis protein CcmF
MTIGPYRLVCQSYTQDSNANYDSEYALLDVYQGNHFLGRMAPERRFYHASEQTSTMVANHSTLRRDLYVVYEGRSQETDKPIIKVFINPLVAWIWIGVLVIVLGTLIALTPNMEAALVSSRNRSATAAPSATVQGGKA